MANTMLVMRRINRVIDTPDTLFAYGDTTKIPPVQYKCSQCGRAIRHVWVKHMWVRKRLYWSNMFISKECFLCSEDKNEPT